MKRVLVLTAYWPPDGSVGTHRVAKTCKYLGDFGWEPVVLAFAPSGRRDDSLLPDVRGVAHVTRVAPGPGYDRLERLRPDSQEAPSAWKELLRLNLMIPDSRIGYHRPALRQAREMVARLRPQVLFSTAPPYTPHRVARILAREFNLPWVCDFRDPWLENHTYPASRRFGLVHRRVTRMEQEVLAAADRVVAANPRLAGLLAAKLPRDQQNKVKVVANGYDPGRPLSAPPSPPDEFRIQYYGTVYEPGFPSGLVEALGQFLGELAPTDPARLVLTGHVPSTIVHRLRDVLAPDRLTLQPWKPHREVMMDLACPQVLMLVVNQFPQNEATVPSKFYEYAPTGNPMLAVGPPNGDLADLLRDTGTGRLHGPDQVAAMVQFLRHAHEDWRAGRLQGPPHPLPAYHRRKLTGQFAAMFDKLAR